MTEPLRVLMLGDYSDDPIRTAGGVAAANDALARGLAAEDAVEKVLVIDVRKRPPPSLTIGDKIEVRFLKVPFVNGDSLIRSWFAVQSVRKIVRSFRPHVVHAHGINRFGDIATQLDLPSVVTVHGMVHMEARLTERSLLSPLKIWSLDRIVKSLLAKARVVISISDYDARTLGAWIKGQRVSIPNAVPDAFFKAFCPPSTEPVVVFAGLMRERKNVLGLVNAFVRVHEAIPNARLKILGPTYDEGYLAVVKARVSETGLDKAVDFLGHVETDTLIAALAGGTALALFSREETLPTIIAQAMAMGRPVVASDVGGISSMIAEGESGYLVASEDEAALAERLITVLRDPALARRMGEAGAVAARERYTAASVVQRTLAAYRLAISG